MPFSPAPVRADVQTVSSGPALEVASCLRSHDDCRGRVVVVHYRHSFDHEAALQENHNLHEGVAEGRAGPHEISEQLDRQGNRTRRCRNLGHHETHSCSHCILGHMTRLASDLAPGVLVV
jgi:hypothetical protein